MPSNRRDKSGTPRPTSEIKMQVGLVYNNKGQVIRQDPNMTPQKFKTQMQYFLAKNDFEHVKQLRIGTWLETKGAVEDNNLGAPHKTSTISCTSKNVRIPFSGFTGRVATRNERNRPDTGHCVERKPKMWTLPPVNPNDVKCQIVVSEEDTLACAASLHDELIASGTPDGVVAVLNMACFKHPGGGLLHGAGAQEENLCRRTNLLHHLQTATYPLNIAQCHMSQGVYYFRGTEADGYPLLKPEDQKRLCVVSAAGYNCPPVVKDAQGENRLLIPHAAGLYLTICAIIRGAKEAGAKRLVLSALGCGAYGTPPKDVARLFAHAIKTLEFQGKIVFAILPDHRHGNENVEVFRQEFAGFGK